VSGRQIEPFRELELALVSCQRSESTQTWYDSASVMLVACVTLRRNSSGLGTPRSPSRRRCTRRQVSSPAPCADCDQKGMNDIERALFVQVA